MTLYLKHFGMHEAPFRITPTTEFFYGGGRRGEILHALQYAIEVGEGIMMITGEVGSGKTMLLRTLSEKLPPEVELVYIANPSFSGRAILYNICEELELDIDIDRPDAVRRLQKYLIERHAQGKRVVALIDEAQAMPDESLEEIRLLSNLETGRNKLLQIAMFGQPELLDKLSRQNMRQLRERITVSLNLEPFSRDDIREYISTRLHASGYNGSELFSKDGCHLLAVVSQGLSRRINVLADKALLSAFERGHDKVTYDDVRRAVRDAKFGKMRYRSEQARRFSRHLTAGIAVTACIVLTIAISSRLGNLSEKTPPAAVAQSAADNSSSDSLSDSSSDSLSDSSYDSSSDSLSDSSYDSSSDSLSDSSYDSSSDSSSDSLSDSSYDSSDSSSDSLSDESAESESVETETETVAATVAAVAQISPEAELLSVIAADHRGEEINGEKLGEQIAAVAENHRDPDDSRDEWQSDIIRSAGLVDNENWGWMPEESYLRQRLNATETWMQDTPEEGYTARLLTVGQDRHVFLERFLRHFADFYPLRNLMIYPLQLGDRKRFVVTFGIYANRDDTKVFINHMPRYFIGGKPFAQRIQDSIAESENYWR